MPGLADSFADYRTNGAKWITLAKSEFYPDTLVKAVPVFSPILLEFGRLLTTCESSADLYAAISASDSAIRVQLARIFKRYVSPSTPVEMLKRKTDAGRISRDFGDGFRSIADVRSQWSARPHPDEALCALLWEYKERGKKGYDLTEQLFGMLRARFRGTGLVVEGPERAGLDIRLGDVFARYPKPTRPVDFLIRRDNSVLVVGFAHYDSDRGGGQEDDRPGGSHNAADEILDYAEEQGLSTKVIFVNDGPGLLLGTMWDDYAALEASWPGRILVVTLKLLERRLTLAWLTE